jgi:hypothetical protein
MPLGEDVKLLLPSFIYNAACVRASVANAAAANDNRARDKASTEQENVRCRV